MLVELFHIHYQWDTCSGSFFASDCFIFSTSKDLRTNDGRHSDELSGFSKDSEVLKFLPVTDGLSLLIACHFWQDLIFSPFLLNSLKVNWASWEVSSLMHCNYVTVYRCGSKSVSMHHAPFTLLMGTQIIGEKHGARESKKQITKENPYFPSSCCFDNPTY